MKVMRLLGILGILVLLFSVNVRAEDSLIYAGSGSDLDGGMNNNRVQRGTTSVAQMSGNTASYGAEYPAYASFMQSPYGPTGNESPYGSSYNSQMGGTNGMNADPLGASEVSPYSRYSPYIEVIGEGSDYTLGTDDVVTIIVRNQPDFSGRFVVDPEGNIQYNFVGDIPATGKTKEQLKADIVKGLRKYVRYPEIAVMISEYRSKAVYVFGFVNAPGKYAMKGNKISVKEAIVAAGLPRMDGSLNKVYVIRPSDFTKDGKPAKKQVDLKGLLIKGDSTDNFILEPGDTIVVNQKYFDKFVNAFTRLIGPVFQAAAVYELGDRFSSDK